MNSQPIEKLVTDVVDGSLDVHSIFYTLQGEGPHSGKPAIFLRLAGCNLRCPGCDTEYTQGRQRKSVSMIRDEIDTLRFEEHPHTPFPIVVITGGEPFRQNITPMCRRLITGGYQVQVETNGTLPPSDALPTQVEIVCSPKTGKIDSALAQRVTAMKYVLRDGFVMNDGLPTRALDHTCAPCVARPPEDFKGEIYVQPMDEGNMHANRKNLKAATQSAMKHDFRLQIQLHKIAGIE